MEKQIILPPAIYTIYDFFDKTRDIEWKTNPFVFYKNINDITIKIARDISNLNFYQIDIPIYGKINPKFIIKYLQNIDYRNYYAANTLYYKLITKIDNHKKSSINLNELFKKIVSQFVRTGSIQDLGE